MKKIAMLVMTLFLVMMLPLTAAAQGTGIELSTGGMMKSGRLIYLNVASAAELRSLQLRVTFDPSVIEYRALCQLDSGEIGRASCQNGVLEVVYAAENGESGTLFGIRFKALCGAETTVSVTPLEVIGGALGYLGTPSSMTVKLSISGSSASSKTSSSAHTAQQSTVGEGDNAVIGTAPATVDSIEPTILRHHVTAYIVIPCALLLAAVLIWVGILIGRRTRRDEHPSADGVPDNPFVMLDEDKDEQEDN